MSILDAVTNLQQSQALDRLAKEVEKLCLTCHGAGRNIPLQIDFPSEIQSCVPCKGSGTIHLYPHGTGDWLSSRPCVACKGIGGFVISRPSSRNPRGTDSSCESCHGTGKQSEWPSMVWRYSNKEHPLIPPYCRLLEAPIEGYAFDNEHYGIEDVHALDYLTAFAFLAATQEYSFSINLDGERFRDGDCWADKDSVEIVCTSPSELLDKALAEMKGAADDIH